MLGVLRGVGWFRRGALALLIFSVAEAFAEPHVRVEWYVEALTLDENPGQSLESTARLLFWPNKAVHPYLGFSYLDYQAFKFAIHRRSPMVGLRWDVFPFLRVFYEFRRAYDALAEDLTHDDPRLGAIAFYFKPLVELPVGLTVVTDSYAELMQMDRYSRHPMVSGWSKMALPWNARPLVYVDAYGEFNFQETSDPALGRKVREVRAGVRAGAVWNRLGVSVHLFHRLDSWVDSPQARWRLLLAAGGQF